MDNMCTFSTMLAKERNAKSYENQCTVCLNKQTTQCTSRRPQAIPSVTAEPKQLVTLLQRVELNCVGRVCAGGQRNIRFCTVAKLVVAESCMKPTASTFNFRLCLPLEGWLAQLI